METWITCIANSSVVQTISKNNNNNGNSSKKDAKQGAKVRVARRNTDKRIVDKVVNELAKTKSKKNRRRQPRTGGSIDNFPRGTSQRYGFAANKRRMVVAETEYIAEVVSNSTGFSVLSSYAINPGQAASFPWLSRIAQNFEKYRFLELRWIYKPEVSQFANNGQTGKILMSVDYDASDAQPSSKQQMEDVWPHSDSMPYQGQNLICSPKEMHKNSDAKYVRPGGLPGSTDIKTYDAGNLFIGISGITANSGTLGELHVQYVVEFTVPVLESTTNAPKNNTVTLFESVNEASAATTVSKQMLLATTVTNGLNAVNNAGTISISPGNYSIDLVAKDSNSTAALTDYFAQLRVNGTAQNPNLEFNDDDGVLSGTVTGVFFVSISSGDLITVTTTATYSGGTNTQNISLRITSI